MIFVSIAQDNSEFAALKCGVDFYTAGQSQVDGKPANLQHKELLIPREIAKAPQKLPAAFADIAAEFSKWVADDEVTILVSQVRPMGFNPLLKSRESLLAMLILAFPEVRWFFGTILGYKEPADKDALDGFRTRHGLYNLFQPQQTTLFDGAGLRDWVRQRAKEYSGTEKDAGYVPRREQLAIAMDEETDYAHLHAYTAYRFGFRALAISSRAAADAVLGANAGTVWGIPDVVLEDLFLNFPDGGDRLSDLGGIRRKDFPILERVSPPITSPTKRVSLPITPLIEGVAPPIEEVFLPIKESLPIEDVFSTSEKKRHRILVTSGQRLAGDTGKNARNKQYIAERRIRLLYKPHAGIFSIWEQSGLNRRLSWREKKGEEKESTGKFHRGTGEGYVWPPDWRKFEQESVDAGGSGHSSPGIFLLIARHLIDRAEAMLTKGLSSVEGAVRGAVLASDALELLGGKTPTTAAEAFSLKHQFELHAECQFTGIDPHIPLRSRFDEIKRDAESIARWFRPQEKARASLNIRMIIVNQLVRILRAHNQFDEEQECMSRVRRLHNSLYMQEQPWRYIFWPVLRYSEFLLSSLLRFTLAIVLWIGGLTWLFDLMFDAQAVVVQNKANTLPNLPLGDAITTFLGVAPVSYSYWSIGFSAFAIIAGLAHLGIFISYLYTLVSRR